MPIASIAPPFERAPGIDPLNNPLLATQPFGLKVFAPLCMAGGMVDVATGQIGAKTGSPVFSIDQDLGPCFSFSSTQAFTWSGMPSINPSSAQESIFTAAAIIKYETSSATTKVIGALNSSPVGSEPLLIVSSADILLGGFWSSPESTNITIALNEPYFVFYMSVPEIGANGRAYGFVKNLRTGAEKGTITVRGANTIGTSGTTWSVGNAGGTRPFRGKIAAVWFSGSRLPFASSLSTGAHINSLADIIGDDPWSLWYQRIPRAYYGASAAAATFQSAWARNSNSIIGKGAVL